MPPKYISSPIYSLVQLCFLNSLRWHYCQSQMTINHDAENSDPITGFTNPFAQMKLDTDTILIQRRNFDVTTYHLVDDANGHPIFTRPIKDRGKKFIFFNNPSFPQGSGHYIILRKMEGQNKKAGFNPLPMSVQNGNQFNKMPQFFYETFSLSFKDSLSGSVTDLDPLQYNIVKLKSGLKRVNPQAQLQRRLRPRGSRKRGYGGPYRTGSQRG